MTTTQLAAKRALWQLQHGCRCGLIPPSELDSCERILENRVRESRIARMGGLDNEFQPLIDFGVWYHFLRGEGQGLMLLTDEINLFRALANAERLVFDIVRMYDRGYAAFIVTGACEITDKDRFEFLESLDKFTLNPQ